MHAYTSRVAVDALDLTFTSLYWGHLTGTRERPPQAGQYLMWHEPIIVSRAAGLQNRQRSDGTYRRKYTGPTMRKRLRAERERVLSSHFIEEVTGHARQGRQRRQNLQKLIDEAHRKKAHHDHPD